MKSTVKEPVQITWPFPKLMVGRDNIVLFTSNSCGTVVASVSTLNNYPIGHHRTDWIMLSFKEFEGEVTLCNDSEKE